MVGRRLASSGSASSGPNADPLAEEETITQFESFLCAKGVAPADRLRCFKQVGKVSITSTAVRDPALAVEEVGPAQYIVPDEEPAVESIPEVPRADKRLKSESSRTQVLPDNPKKIRDHARRSLEPGYYLSASGRNATRILHFLGDCSMVLGIDHVRYQHMGHFMPSMTELDGVCKTLLQERIRTHPRVQWYRDLVLDVAGRDLSQNETWCWQ